MRPEQGGGAALARCPSLALRLATAALFAALPVSTQQVGEQQAIPILNAKDLEGLHPFVAGEPNGYLMTEQEYNDCRVRIQHKWATTEPGLAGNGGSWCMYGT